MRRVMSPFTSCRDNRVSIATNSAGFREAGAELPGGNVSFVAGTSSPSSPMFLSPVAMRIGKQKIT